MMAKKLQHGAKVATRNWTVPIFFFFVKAQNTKEWGPKFLICGPTIGFWTSRCRFCASLMSKEHFHIFFVLLNTEILLKNQKIKNRHLKWGCCELFCVTVVVCKHAQWIKNIQRAERTEEKRPFEHKIRKQYKTAMACSPISINPASETKMDPHRTSSMSLNVLHHIDLIPTSNVFRRKKFGGDMFEKTKVGKKMDSKNDSYIAKSSFWIKQTLLTS
jgi:hypothetical protein